jgi:zinc protease
MTATVRPAPSASRSYHFPRFERRSLPNGLGLVIARVDKLPLVTALMIVDGGAACDPAGAEGVASLAARAMVEGTATADGATLAEQLERTGASLEPSADWDHAAAMLTVTSQRLSGALDLMSDIITAPSFPEREVERLKSERLAELLQTRAEPRGLADEMFARILYAPASRYAAPDGGTPASVGALTREHVVRFHAARYGPRGVTLILVGDVDADQAARMLPRRLREWSAEPMPPIRTDNVAARGGRAVHMIVKEGAPQSELRIGHVGVPRMHPDYFHIVVMNAIVGGLFSSRINLNLREAHGYTYGAFSQFDWRRSNGPFVVSTAVRSDVTGAAIREVLSELERIRQDPVSHDELSLATSYLDGVFPIRYETTAAIANALGVQQVYGLPADYFDTYRERIRGVTADNVLAAARRHLHPEQVQIVVVGDPATVRAPLEQLDAGPLSAYDVEGRLIN